MSVLELLAGNLGAVLAAMSVLWLVSLAMKNASIVDIFWGPAIVGLGWLAWLRLDGPREALPLVAAASVWGARLALYIGARNAGKPEDVRYRKLREKYAPFWWKSLPIVFLLQGALAFVVSLPLQLGALASRSTPPHDGLVIAGLLVFLVGLGFETVADAQMAAHRRRRRAGLAAPEDVMDRGLWSWSRHPNYFGEAVAWWGLGVVATAPLGPPVVWAALLGPVVITWLLTRLSGVPMLEDVMKTRPGWPAYVAKTSAFIPRPPRSP